MKKLKWKLEISLAVSPVWVEDGFDATPKWITEFLRENLLTYSRHDELTISVKTISAPEKSKIKKLQGYE